MKKRLWAAVLTVLVLCGCSNVNEETAGQPRPVTGISASYQKGAIALRREYADDEKMRGILNYLRLTPVLGAAEADPEATEGSRIQIVLHYSDGTEKVYDQWADQFLRCDGGPWMSIPPEKGQELALLLGMTESD